MPGPKLYAITALPRDIQHYFKGTFFRDVLALHAQYGRVIRIAPNDIAVDGDPGWDDCFSLRRSGRPEFIRDKRFFTITIDEKTPAIPSIFDTDREGHRRQRRILAHAFSKQAMFEQEPIIKKYVDLLIIRARSMAVAGKLVDIVKWYNFTTFDIIGDLTFGESFDCLQQSEMHSWVALIFNTIKATEMLRFIMNYPITRFVTLALYGKQILQARADHRQFTVEKTKRRLVLGPAKERKDFMSYILKNNADKGMTEDEIVGNSESLIIAGSETTATALSGITYYLMKNPRAMQRLKDEIRGTFASDEEITMKSTFDLPYTRACIEEGLRVLPPVVISPTRVSPGDFVGGYYIPQGVSLSNNINIHLQSKG